MTSTGGWRGGRYRSSFLRLTTKARRRRVAKRTAARCRTRTAGKRPRARRDKQQPCLPANNAALEVIQSLGVRLLDEYHHGGDEPDDRSHPVEYGKDDQAGNARYQPQQGRADARGSYRLHVVPHGYVLVGRKTISQQVHISR